MKRAAIAVLVLASTLAATAATIAGIGKPAVGMSFAEILQGRHFEVRERVEFWAEPGAGTTLDDVQKFYLDKGFTITTVDTVNNRVHVLSAPNNGTTIN